MKTMEMSRGDDVGEFDGESAVVRRVLVLPCAQVHVREHVRVVLEGQRVLQ